MEFVELSLKQKIKRFRKFASPYRIDDGNKFRLKDIDPGDTGDLTSEDKKAAKEREARMNE